MRLTTRLIVAFVCFWTSSNKHCHSQNSALFPESLAENDYASVMIDGIDSFVTRELRASVASRSRYWNRDFSSRENYDTSLTPNRKRLAHIIGAADTREPFEGLELISTTSESSLIGKGEGFEIHAVRWPVFRNVTGEGLLIKPTGAPTIGCAIVIPDSDQTPEQLAGLVPGIDANHLFATRLAIRGCTVVIPALIDRADTHSITYAGRGTNQSHREFIYRPAFEMGHHVIGYEVQKVLALVDWFSREDHTPAHRRGVIGYGDGGMIALLAAALDPRIDTTLVSGYFRPREEVWSEPIDHNVFRLLDEFGDAELAAMIAPRRLFIEACRCPEVAGPLAPKAGRNASAAPGRLTTPSAASVLQEVDRAKALVQNNTLDWELECVLSGDGTEPGGSPQAIEKWWHSMFPKSELHSKPPMVATTRPHASEVRLKRQFDELVADTQYLMREGERARKMLWSQSDRSSMANFSESSKRYRDHFYNEVIGRFEKPLLAPNPRTRKLFDEPKYTGYEVTLDVFQDVIASGILLLPKDMKPGEQRPVVVCQHGLEGRPSDLADPKIESPYYHQFAIRLAEQGFITYSPQNPYIFEDRFRVLQRKLNPLGKTLFSIIVPQHQQTVDWLGSLPMVDSKRIAFYGLSYGGKTAMRVPPLVDGYCLSICSGDFNEWIWKNASLSEPFTYPATGEYEIFEFDLGNTYNYAEMAALIAPRPFMVERGHRDGVGIDEWVNYEYAKVRMLYADLKIPDLTTIEHFDGPHEIHGVGTFEFLRKHLHWRQLPTAK